MRNCMRVARRGDGSIRILRAATTCCGPLIQSDSHNIYYHEFLDRIITLTKGNKRLPEYQVKDALRALQILENKYEKK
jgi:hypothetical protein